MRPGIAALRLASLIVFTVAQDCPDPSYQVTIIRAVHPANVHTFTPANMEAELTWQKTNGWRIEDNTTSGCVIQRDKLAKFKEVCPDWEGCRIAPLCYIRYTETDGRLQYRLRHGIMPDNCAGQEIAGFVVTNYDCCDAVAPIRELYQPRVPDWIMSVNLDEQYAGWQPYTITFFTWPTVLKPKVCPDRTYMVPVIRTYSDESNRLNNYFFTLDDTSDWALNHRAFSYRLESMWSTGCAIRKDRLDELEFACPKYKKCVKPLCSARWKDPATGIKVFRLEMGDWEEPYCGDYPHIGYIATTPGCCGANTLMYTLVRNKRQPPLPAYHHSTVAAEVRDAIARDWSIESQHFYVWPMVAMA